MLYPTYDKSILDTMLLYRDHFRYATIGLAAKRIQSEEIPGSIAELGVYRGDLSRFIHAIAPDRVFYLFDTFEGFPDEDLGGKGQEDNRFKDTSAHVVMRNIGDTKNIVVRKGYVPDTLNGLEHERFALVVLDMDKYKPTLAALEFVYDRLSKGGYLFVHDYNSPESNRACSRALSEFMKDKPERIIETADRYGSALFRKL